MGWAHAGWLSPRKRLHGTSICQNRAVAPSKRHAEKALVGAWVTRELKDQLLARAAVEGINQTDAVVQALEEWLQKPRPDSP